MEHSPGARVPGNTLPELGGQVKISLYVEGQVTLSQNLECQVTLSLEQKDQVIPSQQLEGQVTLPPIEQEG